MNVDEIMALVRQYAKFGGPELVSLADIEIAIKALIPDSTLLTLPTPPPGTVALIGVESGRRWTLHEESGGWQGEMHGGAPWKLSAVLDCEGPKGVRAELAPPPAPRTAAEIWADTDEADRAEWRTMMLGGLAQALDREAGLAS